MTTAESLGIVAYPMGFRSLALNNQRDTAGAFVRASERDATVVEKFDFSPLDFRDQRDGLHLMLGGDLGVVSGEFRFVSMLGYLVGSTAAKLEDRVAALMSAFDPENCVAASPSTRGVHALDFYCPTDSPPTGHSSPVREVFYGRPTGLPAVFERRGEGYVKNFALQLICPDVRRYLYTAESKAATSGNSWTVTIPNWAAATGAPTKATVQLVLTGTGSSNCTLRYVDTLTSVTTDLVLDLSGLSAAAHTLDIDLGTGTIKEGSTYKANLRTSAVNTGVWQINAGGGTFSVPTGRTALTSATLAYRQARA